MKHGSDNYGHRLTRLAASLALMLAGPTAFADDLSGPPLKNGVGLHGPMTWGRTDAAHTQYTWPVYADAKYDVPVALLAKVKAAGFDMIRLTIDPGPFLAAKGAQSDDMDKRLMDTVAAIRQTGLDVIVDFHPIGMLKAYAPDRLEANSEGVFDAYVGMVRHVAGLLAPQSEHVAIEVMNEPQLGYNPKEASHLQGMEVALFKAVRAGSPDMTVIVSGGRGGGIDGLLNLDPTPFDKNTRFSFHYYLPYIFSMQGVKNGSGDARVWQFVSGLPYPANPSDLVKYWVPVKIQIDASNLSPEDKARVKESGEKQLDAYFNGKGTPAAIKADFDKVSQWAQAHGIPAERIFVGEFDTTQNIPGHQASSPDDRARWLTDVRTAAESRGFHWSLWNLGKVSESGGMTLVSVTDPQTLDAKTLKALGKQPATQ
jgi:hypothetical protein